MKRFIWTASLGVGLLFSGQAVAQAQQDPFSPPGKSSYTPYSTPISPYLNLLRPGSAAFNYFSYVKPQVDFNKAFQVLEKQVQKELKQPQPEEKPTKETELPATGARLPAYFTHTRYYGTPQTGGASPSVTPGRPVLATPSPRVTTTRTTQAAKKGPTKITDLRY